MLYCSWDMPRDGGNYFSFWLIFCPFTLLTALKIKIKKKKKKTCGDIIVLHKCTKNHDHMLYCSWDMARDRCNCYFLFWAISCPFTSLTAQKIKILKKWTKLLEISSFYIRVPKIMIRWCMVPEIWCTIDGRMEGWTDRWKKWHIEVVAPPKNKHTVLSLKIQLPYLLISYL